MAQKKLVWNGKDAQGNPLRWNTPGLVWNGFVPEKKGMKQMNTRVLLGFANADDHALEERAEAVIKGLTGNAAFPTPPVTPVALQTSLTAFSAALGAQQMGGMAATAAKNDARAALIGLLRQQAAYVQTASNGDLTTLLSSGFEAASTNHAQTALDQPVIAKVENGNSGQLLVTIKPVANARAYEVRSALIGAGGTPGPWQGGGLFTSSRAMPVSGLTRGQDYALSVRAIGGSTGYSDWSDPTTHMCT